MKKYAFWKYDLYPFTLWGEIDESKIHSSNPTDFVYIPSYASFFRHFLILEGEHAQRLITELKLLKSNYEFEQDNLKKKFVNNLEYILPSHPRFDKVGK